MKKFCTLKNKMTGLVVVALLLVSVAGFAQPEYSFTNPTLLSGTNLQVNAKYRFSAVRPGIDALMTITAISPGIGLTQLDGPSGYAATLQPTITAAPWTSGYVEMTITFVYAGTSNPMVQPQLAATPFDVDGVTNYDGQGHNLYEFDQVNMGGGYYDFNTVGGELSITQSGNWFTGTNIAAVDYPGRDTSAQQVMFSVLNTNVTTVTLRFGVNNQTAAAATRERCVYFKKFVFNNSILALNEPARLRREKKNSNPDVFAIYPTVIQQHATINISANRDGWANFEVYDLTGRLVINQQLVVNKGENKVPFFGSSKMGNGNYVALLKMDGEVYNYKLIKQ
jgi:hypothetical protein